MSIGVFISLLFYNRKIRNVNKRMDFCRKIDYNRGQRRGVRKMPTDPVMLLSFVNLKLRDFYGSLDAMCDDLDADRQQIVDRLAAIDYHYDEKRNQFV